MHRFSSMLILCLIAASIVIPANAYAWQHSDGVPDQTTAGDLAEVWLRFHEVGLCQGVDAVFTFHEKGMEITGTIVDEKSYEKFQGMLQPLRASYHIDLKLDQPKAEAKAEEDKDKDKDPPASLWENYELRSFLGDPFARAKEREGFDEGSQLRFPPPDETLKQRLLIFAEQTLAWNGQIERYAKHLPALTRMAADTGLKPGLRSHANAVAGAHAKDMERLLGKLSANLEPALPHSRMNERASKPDKSAPAAKTVTDRAGIISEFAQTACLRVYQFIHPEHYTVGLSELRQPSLLESLRELQQMDSEFLKILAKSK